MSVKFSVLLFMLFFSIGCENLHHEKTKASPHAINIKEIKNELTFWDSVRMKLPLPLASIKKNTVIDSVYQRSESTFEGDSVFIRQGKYSFALVSYSDHLVCSLKFLLVFDNTNQKNTDYKQVSIDCDRPEGEPYRTISYQILNDSTIVIIDSYYENSLDANVKPKVDKEKWRLGNDGVFFLQ